MDDKYQFKWDTFRAAMVAERADGYPCEAWLANFAHLQSSCRDAAYGCGWIDPSRRFRSPRSLRRGAMERSAPNPSTVIIMRFGRAPPPAPMTAVGALRVMVLRYGDLMKRVAADLSKRKGRYAKTWADRRRHFMLLAWHTSLRDNVLRLTGGVSRSEGQIGVTLVTAVNMAITSTILLAIRAPTLLAITHQGYGRDTVERAFHRKSQ
jgi:hypothetical protein